MLLFDFRESAPPPSLLAVFSADDLIFGALPWSLEGHCVPPSSTLVGINFLHSSGILHERGSSSQFRDIRSYFASGWRLACFRRGL